MKAYSELESIFKKLSHLHHLQAINGWDEAVMMPVGGGEARAQALATLGLMTHELLTQPHVGNLIQKAKQENLNNPWEIANLRWMEKKYLNATCLPADLVHALTEAAITSEQAWRSLRADNNWKDFAPLLEKTLSLVKESANIRAEIFNQSPYDVLLDEYSPGVNQQIIDPIFHQLKEALPSLIQQAIKKQSSSTPHAQTDFPIDKQKSLSIDLMHALGFDFNRGRLDVSHHPFCGGVPQDVRITTRYRTDEFVSAAMGVCHETGHARYEQGLPVEWLFQPVGQALGMAVHESQSLLIEMQACRSLEFMHLLSPLVKKYFGDDPAFSPENLYQTYTHVKPDFIRVDADELCYPLHIVLRYEIEKQLINGKMKIADLPDAWDQSMTQYFGLSTKNNYKNGVMQDVHWPSGAFGYFPAYTLGSLIAAQLFHTAKKAHPTLLENIKHGDFTPLFDWLGKNIHSKGSSLDFEKLMISATGEPLNPNYFIEHVKKRYL